MREIKFRAWDDKRGMWLDNFQLWKDGKIVGKNHGYKNLHIEQFTGLRDKNGVEIYEGDILETGGIIAPCTWNRDMGCFELDTEKEAYFPWDILEVIGNIHQNPELLK